MRFRVSHRTTYRYGATVMLSHHLLHLTPRPTPNQRLLEHRIDISPLPSDPPVHRQDFYGNESVIFDIDAPHERFEVTATSVVVVDPPGIPAPDSTMAWEDVRDRVADGDDPAQHAVADFVARIDQPVTARQLAEYVAPSFLPGRPILAAAFDLACRINADFVYDPSATTVATPLATVLKQRRGVCQDFAHLMIAGLRVIGLPARYVSGYLMTRPPEGKPRLVGADQSHAWVGVFIPGHGWVDLDPTNAMLVGEEHVTLAWGRNFGDVVPVKGVITGGGEHLLSVEVDVAPVEVAAAPKRRPVATVTPAGAAGKA